MPDKPQSRVEAAAHGLDRVHQAADPLQRVELALQRHDDAGGGHQRVQRQQTQGPAGSPAESPGTRRIPAASVRAFRSRNSRFSAGTSSISAPARSLSEASSDRLGDRGRADRLVAEVAVHQQVVGAAMPLRAGDAQAGRGVSLRVHVDQQDGQPGDRERSSEIDRRRGLADAAFLVRHGQDKWFGDDSPRGHEQMRRRTTLVRPGRRGSVIAVFRDEPERVLACRIRLNRRQSARTDDAPRLSARSAISAAGIAGLGQHFPGMFAHARRLPS